MKYYDVKSGRAKTLSTLETWRTNEVFSEIGGILSKNDYKMKGRYVSCGICDCLTRHNITRFIVELNSNEMPLEIIDDIRDALKGLSVDFTNIISQRSKLILVFVQNF
jgi:hypothetical protein